MRKDDVAKTRTLNREVRCYNCQKPAKKEVINYYGEKPNEKYNGNYEIKREIPIKDSDGKIRYKILKNSPKNNEEFFVVPKVVE